MAERKAMASGLSVSDMATEGGCGRKMAVGGGTWRGRASAGSAVASWATEAVGVMGDTGGRSGEAEVEAEAEAGCVAERSDVVEATLEEAGRVFVSTRSAGMAAWKGDVSGRRAEKATRRLGGEDRPRRGLGGGIGKSLAVWRRCGAF